MKGIVFTEFLEFVESQYGLDMVNDIINKSKVPSQGTYTAIGTYDFHEMLALLTQLGDSTNLSTDTLLHVFGSFFVHVIEDS